jgi:hypothetical protein
MKHTFMMSATSTSTTGGTYSIPIVIDGKTMIQECSMQYLKPLTTGSFAGHAQYEKIRKME